MHPSRSRLLLPCLCVSGALLASLFVARAARADVLELKDGRFVEGVVMQDGDALLVLSRFGVSEIPASDVVARTTCKAADLQVKEALARLAPEDTANRLRLATWIGGLGREDEAHAIAEEILALDPEHAGAHALLGHVRHQGTWVHPDEARRAEGLERHGDAWYTPDEWRNLGAAERQAAEAVGERLERERTAREVQKLLTLMTSPDDAVRRRARGRLERLAKETESEALAQLLPRLDDYVKAVDEARVRAAEWSDTVMTGEVLGDFRVTLAKLKRPIREFTTNLAAGPIGANAPVTLQLPELEVIKVRTTGLIPVVGP
jgi:hypothetical protein